MHRFLLPLLLVATACAARPKPVTIRGADLYVKVGELRARGEALIENVALVRREHFLVDRSRDQVFVVGQVVDGCTGAGIDNDPECTLALLRDQRFEIDAEAPKPRAQPRDPHGDGISPYNKTRIVLAAALVPLTIGAFKCDAFEGCGGLLGAAVGADALLLLILTTGLR